MLVKHAELHCTLDAIALTLRPQLVLLLPPARKHGGSGVTPNTTGGAAACAPAQLGPPLVSGLGPPLQVWP